MNSDRLLDLMLLIVLVTGLALVAGALVIGYTADWWERRRRRRNGPPRHREPI